MQVSLVSELDEDFLRDVRLHRRACAVLPGWTPRLHHAQIVLHRARTLGVVVMERMHGKLEDIHRFQDEDPSDLAQQLATLLAAMQRKGFVHGDLQLDNLAFTKVTSRKRRPISDPPSPADRLRAPATLQEAKRPAQIKMLDFAAAACCHDRDGLDAFAVWGSSLDRPAWNAALHAAGIPRSPIMEQWCGSSRPHTGRHPSLASLEDFAGSTVAELHAEAVSGCSCEESAVVVRRSSRPCPLVRWRPPSRWSQVVV